MHPDQRPRFMSESPISLLNMQKQIAYSTKGQIISEQNCGVLNFTKIQGNYCPVKSKK